MPSRLARLGPRLGALALTFALLAGAAIAALKGAWWSALGFALAWLLLQILAPIWQRAAARRRGRAT